MPGPALHTFERQGRRYAIDPDACFCFECDDISWDVLRHYPHETPSHIAHLLRDRHEETTVHEVISELDWLRATRAILATPKPEELARRYEVEQGVKRVDVLTTEAGIVARAAALLFARAGTQRQLTLVVHGEPAPHLANAARDAFALAKLAGKTLTFAVRSPLAVQELRPHAAAVQMELTAGANPNAALDSLQRTRRDRLKSWPAVLHPTEDGVGGRVVLTPGSDALAGSVELLDKAGFPIIEIDLGAGYRALGAAGFEALTKGFEQAAVYYANRLLGQHFFRLDPVAEVFRRIYQGEAVFRGDPEGTNALAVDAQGAIYPGPAWTAHEDFRFGTLDAGIEEDRVAPWENLGALTTPACIQCWARGLCGGGQASVHHALSGDYRTPHAAWCAVHRAWLEGAVSAFNTLSSAGVNFTRVYQVLGPQKRPSLFKLAKAAFRMQLGLRPIEEGDAERLAKWENWNDAAYFAATESSLFLATQYDREMDALYPRTYEQEFLLLRRNGEPLGLLRVRPERMPGTARAWLYFRKPEDAASAAVRRSFRAILDEAAGQQALRRILVPVGPADSHLPAFLEAVGFTHAGAEREALYLHGVCHDLQVYVLTLAP
jgi:radical SAM protein with 4Fe4S-binding SPASM domain